MAKINTDLFQDSFDLHLFASLFPMTRHFDSDGHPRLSRWWLPCLSLYISVARLSSLSSHLPEETTMSTLPQKREMPYGVYWISQCSTQNWSWKLVRLGKSGLKVSRIILGCMSYASPEWDSWVLGEEESLKMIKTAYVWSCTSVWDVLSYN